MAHFRVGFVLLFAAAIVSAGQSAIKRDGNSWIEIETGQIPVGALQRITIVSQGNLRATGRSGASVVSYRIVKRVRAASQRDAQRRFREFVLIARESALSVIVPAWAKSLPELSVEVPRSAHELSLTTTSGDLEVSSFDGIVFLRTGSGLIEGDRLGSNVTITSGGGAIRLGTVVGGVVCSSRGGDIEIKHVGRDSRLETSGGSLAVVQAGGSLHLSSGGGNIRVGRCRGRLRASTGAGRIEVGRSDGLVEAETSGGAIRVEDAAAVRCETGSGSIRLENVRSGFIDALTETGNIVAVMNSEPVRDCSLRTSAGDVTVSFPSNISVRVHASNMTSGSMRGFVSEFPQVRLQGPDPSIPLAMLAEGILNRGGPVVQIYAANGVIYLRRQK